MASAVVRDDVANERVVKAAVIRGFITELKRDKVFEEVVTRVAARSRDIMLNPPPTSTWVDSIHTEDLSEAAAAVLGMRGWRRIAHNSTLNNMVPVLRVVIEGFIRLFGATPATLFARLTQITSTTMRGVRYDYEPTSPTSGVLTLCYTSRRDVPISAFWGGAGGIETIFDVCKVSGRLGDPEMVGDGLHNRARFHVNW